MPVSEIELKATEEHLENIVNLLRRQHREVGISLKYAEGKLKAYQDELYLKYHDEFEDINNPKTELREEDKVLEIKHHVEHLKLLYAQIKRGKSIGMINNVNDVQTMLNALVLDTESRLKQLKESSQ